MKVSSGSAVFEDDIEMGPSNSSDSGYVEVSQSDSRDLNAGSDNDILSENPRRSSRNWRRPTINHVLFPIHESEFSDDEVEEKIGIEITAEEALRDSPFSDEEDDEDYEESIDLIQSPNDSLSRSNRIFKFFTDLTIPHGQYIYGVHIILALSLSAILIDKHDVFSKFLSILVYMSLVSSVPNYFGYELGVSFQVSGPVSVGGQRRYSGGFICKKLTFSSYRMVSFARWLNGLILFATSFIFFLPHDCYKNLEKNYHFPDFFILTIIYIVQTIFYIQKL